MSERIVGQWGKKTEWLKNPKLMIFSETSPRFQTSLLQDAGSALKNPNER
jgi:hypothetical protein